jgi:hypothetical protein
MHVAGCGSPKATTMPPARITKTTKKREKKPSDSDEEWDAKPKRKKQKKKTAVSYTSMDTIHGLESYMAKYESMCNTYKGYRKVMALARLEMNRDVRAERLKIEREEADSTFGRIGKGEDMIPDMTSSLSSPISPDTTSSSK